MFVSRYLPCPDCGASVERTQREKHVCDRARWLEYQLFQRRKELSAFESDFGAYLDTLRGQFDVWYAERRRRR